MIKTVLLVPIRDNDQRPFLHTDWHELERKLLQFGGYTKGGIVDGKWQDGGKVYRDRSRQYIVSLKSWTQITEWLAVVKWAKERFRQEAMYIEVNGSPEILG